MPPNAPEERRRPGGLNTLRRGGGVSELLFLYECTTREVAQLRAIAGTLGLSVQAVSHTYRALVRRGLVQARDGRYRPTVAGVDYLHAHLVDLEADLAERLERLHIVATTRALARGSIAAGTPVVLSVEDGWLVARAGTAGASRGVARTTARRGELVDVERLSGIVPLKPAPVELLTVREPELARATTRSALRAALARRPRSLLAALGVEALHLVGEVAPSRPVLRFGIASAAEEASSLGVPSTVVVLDRDLPRLLAQFGDSGRRGVEVVPLRAARAGGARG